MRKVEDANSQLYRRRVWCVYSQRHVDGPIESQPRHAGTKSEPSPDAIEAAQTPSNVPLTRPEQQQSGHDRLDLFDASEALPSSTAFEQQPDKGQMLGFDFYRAPL